MLSTIQAPDPSLLAGGAPGSGYWAYVTGEGLPALHSRDLTHWRVSGPTLRRPSWVVRRGDWHPWAPDVHRAPGACPGTHSSSCYVMYYVGLNARLNANCVGVALARSPAGPFADRGPLGGVTTGGAARPIGCGDATGLGQIDPSYFVDPKSRQAYLYVSEDYACPPAPAPCTRSRVRLQPTISVIPLAAGGLSAAAPRQALFTGQAGSWEAAGTRAPTVEGPAVVAHDGLYYLLYSGGSWRDAYGEGYAVSNSPVGPFLKSPQNPVLRSAHGVSGVGGSGVPVRGPHGGWWILYHGRSGGTHGLRTLRLDPFRWASGPAGADLPVISGPSVGTVFDQP